jgi:hypothetical protein
MMVYYGPSPWGEESVRLLDITGRGKTIWFETEAKRILMRWVNGRGGTGNDDGRGKDKMKKMLVRI